MFNFRYFTPTEVCFGKGTVDNVGEYVKKYHGTDEEIALAGIKAMESFYHSIGMPINMRELGIEPTEERILEMAHRCALAAGGQQGSAKVLKEEDMAQIYRMAR